MNVVLLGPPGAGKGTQAREIARRRGLVHLSTGDMLRDAIASGSPVGRDVKAIVESGRLVPDETVARVVAARLDRDDAQQGVLFDGFPRTVGQAEILDRILLERGLAAPVVIELDVPDEEVVARLSRRGSCNVHGLRPPGEAGSCQECGAPLTVRADDSPDIVRERLGVYHELTAPLSAFYEARAALHRVDGVGAPEEVSRRVNEAMDGIAC